MGETSFTWPLTLTGASPHQSRELGVSLPTLPLFLPEWPMQPPWLHCYMVMVPACPAEQDGDLTSRARSPAALGNGGPSIPLPGRCGWNVATPFSLPFQAIGGAGSSPQGQPSGSSSRTRLRQLRAFPETPRKLSALLHTKLQTSFRPGRQLGARSPARANVSGDLAAAPASSAAPCQRPPAWELERGPAGAGLLASVCFSASI